MALSLPGWLGGGDDSGLASTTYSGQESASDKAARKAREKSVQRARASKRSATATDRKGWEAVDAGRRVERDREAGRGSSWRDRRKGI
ncbi:hypothetical protein ACFYPC_09495 [Streptomyces sp. NPDC005808]|uniref:hypothetical protein n=1 Tax=Streptomyces sp. NPDC005808 TaxID=3364734 RepID=UPI0036990963